MYVVGIGVYGLKFRFDDREDALSFFDAAVEHGRKDDGRNVDVSMRWEAEDEKYD